MAVKNSVRSRAVVDLVFFSSISTVSQAVICYIEGKPDAFTQLSHVVKDIRANEELLKGDVYESELRSHRLGLEGLLNARNRLHVDEANVIYCYPFTVPWADPADLVKAANTLKEDVANTKPAWTFADQPATVEEFELSDMWDGPAVDRFTGVTISFAEQPHVLTRAEEILNFSEDLTFSLEVRLSHLGNHYVRLEHKLEDASIHDLNQAMRRALPQMGEEKVTFGPPGRFDEGGRPARREWSRLRPRERPHRRCCRVPRTDGHARRARQRVRDQEQHTNRSATRRHAKNKAKEQIKETGAVSTAGEQKATKPERPRKAHPHVIVTARKLSIEQLGSVEDDNSFRRDISVEELPEAKGAALLLQPVRQAAAILEEWCRYSIPDLNEGVTMQPMSFVGNFAYRTTNTTCGLLRGTPEFLIVEHEEAAEFVASLPVLLETWMAQILARANTIDLDEQSSAEDLRSRQLELRQLLTKATTMIAQVRSPELCLTAVHRKYLDEMFELAGIEGLERELQSHFTVLDAKLRSPCN